MQAKNRCNDDSDVDDGLSVDDEIYFNEPVRPASKGSDEIAYFEEIYDSVGVMHDERLSQQARSKLT